MKSFMIKLGRILEHATFNFLSMSLTIIASAILILPVFTEFSLDQLNLLASIDLWILTYLALEMLLRLIHGRTRYLRGPFILDFLVVLPLLLEIFNSIFLSDNGTKLDFPGFLLLKGTRVFRLIYFFQYFYLRIQLGFVRSAFKSSIKSRFFIGISTFVFIFLLGAGMVVSTVHYNLTQTQKSVRISQIVNHSRVYGIASTQQIFSEFILQIRQQGPGKNFEIILKDPEYVKNYFRYEKDFIQIDNVTPGGSIQISFKDLNKRHLFVELSLLVIGIFVVSTLLLSLNHFLEQLILKPVDRAVRVMELRLQGEEILSTEIPMAPFTEIDLLISLFDKLYVKMREPRKPIPELPKP